MQRKKFCVIITVFIIVAAAGSGIYFSIASRSRVSRQAAEQAIALYEQIFGKYYKTLNWTTRLCNRKTDDGIVEERFYLEVQHVMNAETPEELDFCQGMMEWCREHDVSMQKIQQTARYHKILDVIENPTDFVVELKAVYQENNREDIEILASDGQCSYFPFEELAPDDEANRFMGYRYMEQVFGDTLK